MFILANYNVRKVMLGELEKKNINENEHRELEFVRSSISGPFRLSAITFILTLSTFFTVIYSQVGKIPTLELLHGSEAFPSCN